MFATPAAVIGSFFRGIRAIAIIIGGIYLVSKWYQSLPELVSEVRIQPAHAADQELPIPAQNRPTDWHRQTPLQRVQAWRPGLDRESFMLLGGIACLLMSVGGTYLPRLFYLGRTSQPAPRPPAGIASRIKRPDGSEIYVETSGPADKPTVILTHGWSMTREEWVYLRAAWGDQFRIVIWDLPGLGKSKPPVNNDFSLEKFARDLHAVIEASGSEPVILMGHSIGGMTILTFCKLYPELLGARVSKLVLIHTTYVNPLRTMRFSALHLALQKPVIEPLLHLQIWASPLVWAMNWLSYRNGSLHRSIASSGFGGTESWSQVDFIARFYPWDSPAVIARGALGMLAYDATAVLQQIKIPVLVIGAEQDRITTVEASQRIAAETAGQIKVLNPAKHFGLIEYPADFAEQTARFCRQ